jgi:hypothetical protein
VPRFTEEDDALLDELGVQAETKRESSPTAKVRAFVGGFCAEIVQEL